MTPGEIAEALERARYEKLRGADWAELRESERATRVAVAQEALEGAGISAWVEGVVAQLADAEERAGYVAQRDAEIVRLRREHEDERTAWAATLAAASTEHEHALGAVNAELGTALAEATELRTELVALRGEHATVKSVLKALRAEHTVLEAQLVAVRAAHADAQAQLGSLRAEYAKVEAELESLRGERAADLTVLRAQHTTLEAEHATLQAELQVLQAESRSPQPVDGEDGVDLADAAERPGVPGEPDEPEESEEAGDALVSVGAPTGPAEVPSPRPKPSLTLRWKPRLRASVRGTTD